MKQLLSTFTLVLALIAPSFAQTDNDAFVPAHSKITAVTVFTDRALITREATLNLSAGNTTLLFEKLPSALDAGSVQVSGRGAFTLKEVRVRSEYFVEAQEENLKKKLQEKGKLSDSLKGCDQQQHRLQSEKGAVQKIMDKVTSPTDKSAGTELDPSAWIKIVDFYRSRLTLLDKELNDNDKYKTALQERMNKVQREIDDLQNPNDQSRIRLEVPVTAKSGGAITLSVSYVVYGPSWSPQYDLRVDSEKKNLQLTYAANLQQQTGEAWSDVELKLSTAAPQISGVLPVLEPWRVAFFEPRPVYKKARGGMMFSKAAMAPSAAMGAAPEALESEQREESMALMDVAQAEVQTSATSATFMISGKSTVKSDNQPTKVTILVKEFATTLSYTAVPKVSTFAYLTGKVVNNSDYPLLPGTGNVFVDNDYVSTTAVPFVAPGGDFTTGLGVDKAIAIEYKLKNLFKDDKGSFVKKTSAIYEYQTTLTNNRKTETELTVKNHFPLSGNEEIKVELLEPKLLDKGGAIKKDDFNNLEYTLKLKPGEKLLLPLKFQVEYPRDKSLTGL